MADKSKTVARQRNIQAEIAEADSKAGQKKETAMQAGARKYPEPPFPKQHQPKPGDEYKLDPEPMYEAPYYIGSKKLDGMVALITGGDSGIGRAVAILFAREGADVAIAHLAEDRDAEETKRAIEQEGRRCLVLKGDVRQSAFCKEAVEQVVKEFGKLDILVNNAAFQVHAKAIADLTEEHFDETLKTNLYGYFFMAQAAIAADEAGLGDHQHRLGDRHRGQPGAARLFDDQGRHPRLHPGAGRPAHREGHPGERRRAGPGLDAAQPLGQGGGGRVEVRRRRCR